MTAQTQSASDVNPTDDVTLTHVICSPSPRQKVLTSSFQRYQWRQCQWRQKPFWQLDHGGHLLSAFWRWRYGLTVAPPAVYRRVAEVWPRGDKRTRDHSLALLQQTNCTSPAARATRTLSYSGGHIFSRNWITLEEAFLISSIFLRSDAWLLLIRV